MPRVLSGIQPTGRFHWGNYFGAIRQYIDLQDKPETAFYFIADLHALTTVRNPAELRGYTLDAALDLLALGLDPNRASLFLQSDVPEVAQLCWILLSGAPMGLLERCVSYKDKKARGLRADAGLFTYPVLMAADILIYDSDIVPVGEDQVQHIEVARDLAGSFNHEFGETFVLPKEKILDNSARVPGIDGQKMSKSYGNTLAVFEDPKVLRKQIMRIVTDSRTPEQPKPPESDHLFELYSLFASRRAARDAGRHLSPRRIRLRRREEGPGRSGGRFLRPGPAAPRGTCRPSRSGSARFSATGPRPPERKRPKCSCGRRRRAG